jgi:hypothetical protein
MAFPGSLEERDRSLLTALWEGKSEPVLAKWGSAEKSKKRGLFRPWHGSLEGWAKSSVFV